MVGDGAEEKIVDMVPDGAEEKIVDMVPMVPMRRS